MDNRNKTFTIKALPNFTFRVSKIKPTEYLTLHTQIDFKNFKKTNEVFDYILEHLEVEIAGQWTKVKDDDVYMPVGIENNFVALEQLEVYFLDEILIPLFIKSKE